MSDAISILREFNEWRRGNTEDLRHSPSEIGKAIDAACARIAQLEAEIERLHTALVAITDVPAGTVLTAHQMRMIAKNAIAT